MTMKKTLLFIISAFTTGTLSAQQSATPGMQQSPISHTLPLQSYPDELFREGASLYQQGAYGPAAIALKNCLQTMRCEISPSQVALKQEAEYLLASIAFAQREPDCNQCLAAFLEAYPDTPHAHRIYALQATLAYEKGDYNLALALFNASELERLATDERDEMTLRRAISHLEVGQLREAAIWLETLQTTSPRYAEDCHYYLSYIRYAQHRYDEAKSGFMAVTPQSRYATQAVCYRAEIALITQHWSDALQLIDGVLAHDKSLSLQRPTASQEAEAYRIKGSALYHMNRYVDARSCFSHYFSANNANNRHKQTNQLPQTLSGSSRRDAAYMMGLSCYRSEVYTEAIDYLHRVILVADDALTQNAYLHLGLTYLQTGDKAQARMAFAQAAATDFDLTIKEQAAYNYALTIHETAYSAFGESVRVFEKFLNDFPQSRYADRVSSYLVDLYLNTRSYDAALLSISRITNPSRTVLEAKQKILFQLGTEAFADARFSEALSRFDQSIAMGALHQATFADACYWSGETLYRQGLYDEAERRFQRYLTLSSPASGDSYSLAYYNLGYIAFHRKTYTEAANRFQRYLKEDRGRATMVRADALNRLGDCAFHDRRLSEAANYYGEAETMRTAVGDYACYQLALVSGLQKEYQQKIATLSRLATSYPHSAYLPYALYEQGRSYVQLNQSDAAAAAFGQLAQRFPDHPMGRRAAVERALLYNQQDQTEVAIQAYQSVVRQYPGTDEARLALRDLKSLYVDANRVDEYVAFTNQLPAEYQMDVHQQDSLTFVAVERSYMRGDEVAAEQAMTNYLERFPQGAYAEEVLLLRAPIRFNRQAYAEASADYARLQGMTANASRRQLGALGVLRCSIQLQLPDETIQAANFMLSEAKIDPELRTEARYDRAKAFIMKGDTQSAMADFTALSTDTRTRFGAEAKYQVAYLQFQAGNHEAAEQEILQFIEQSTPHAYWLARSFVLLADVYVAKGQPNDARQYLLSLQQNYTERDDIQEMITTRLDKLKSGE